MMNKKEREREEGREEEGSDQTERVRQQILPREQMVVPFSSLSSCCLVSSGLLR
jgi:hypothetical protein